MTDFHSGDDPYEILSGDDSDESGESELDGEDDDIFIENEPTDFNNNLNKSITKL